MAAPIKKMEDLVSYWQTVMKPKQRQKRRRENDEEIRPKTRVFESSMTNSHETRDTLTTPEPLNKA